jgi:hypothetical protein
MKRDQGISETISSILIIVMVLTLAIVVIGLLLSVNIFQQKSATIAVDIQKSSVSGKEVIQIFNRAGDTAYVNMTGQQQNAMCVYVDTTSGSYRIQPPSGVNTFCPGTTLYIYNTMTGIYKITNNSADLADAASPVSLTSVRLIDEKSQMLLAQWQKSTGEIPGSPPSLTEITPLTGSTAGGTEVTLTGTNLIGTNGVTFDGTAATGVSVVSDTSITATTPSHAAGSVDVVVTTPNGTATRTNAYTYVPAPIVTAITPATGNRGWSVSITNLSGSGFQSGATVKLTRSGSSDIVATGVIVTSTRITCTVNLAGATAGAWNVVVTNTDLQSGTLPNGFTVNSPAPVFSTGNPNAGNRGWPVTLTSLTGTGFQPGADVRLWRKTYSDIIATGVNVASSTSINAGTLNLLDATAGSWNYVVINTDGKVSNALTFTVNSPNPTIRSIVPEYGVQGTTVEIKLINGKGFQPSAAVKFSTDEEGKTDVMEMKIVKVESPKEINGILEIPKEQNPKLSYYIWVTNTDDTTGRSDDRIFIVKEA